MDSMPPHAPPTGPDAPATLSEHAFDAIERAIGRHQDAREAVAQAEGDPDGRWAALARGNLAEAEAGLVLAILATDPGCDASEVARHPQLDPWPARGVRHDGYLYLAIPDPRRPEDDPGGHARELMRLAIVDADLVLDMEDQVEHPAPAPVPAPVPAAKPHRLAGVVADIVETLGEQEAFDRLMFCRAYQIVRDACDRLGSDAVAELRRIVDGEVAAAGVAEGIVSRALAVLDAIEAEEGEMILGTARIADPDDVATLRAAVQGVRLARTILAGGPERRARLAAG